MKQATDTEALLSQAAQHRDRLLSNDALLKDESRAVAEYLHLLRKQRKELERELSAWRLDSALVVSSLEQRRLGTAHLQNRVQLDTSYANAAVSAAPVFA